RARQHLVLERRDVLAERREPRHRVGHHLVERGLAGRPRRHRVEAREHRRRRGSLGLRLGLGLGFGRHRYLLVRATLRPACRVVKSDFVQCTIFVSSEVTISYCNARQDRDRRSRMSTARSYPPEGSLDVREPEPQAPVEEAQPPKRYRNYVLAILVVVYTLNFLDRQVLGILVKP